MAYLFYDNDLQLISQLILNSLSSMAADSVDCLIIIGAGKLFCTKSLTPR